jgi:membrane fusion protein, copper/silver efflux system
MKSRILTSIALCFIILAFISGCNKQQKENVKDENAYYTCPMHPQIHENAPGKCPICGMDLVKKEK